MPNVLLIILLWSILPMSSVCTQCGDSDCFYEAINRRGGVEAVMQVARERGLTAQQIEMLLMEYK